LKTKENKVIGIFGEVLADIFPDKTVLGGAPFNVARHLQAFGLRPVLISRTGKDALSTDLLQEMHRLNMDISGVQIDAIFPTGQVNVRLTEDGGHQFDILQDQAYDHIQAEIVHIVTKLLKPDLVYFGTLAQRSTTSRFALDAFLSDGQCPRFLDVNLRAPFYNKQTIRSSLMRSDIVKLNEEELLIIANYFKIDEPSAYDKASQLLAAFNIQQIIVTAGAKGAWMVNKNAIIKSDVETTAKTLLVDTVGAGDAFSAVCILGHGLNWDHVTTLNRANQFASAICSIRGGAPADISFYTPFILEWNL
jgi:fructokinase